MTVVAAIDEVKFVLQKKISAWLARRLGRPEVKLNDVTRLAGGYSNETWKLDFSYETDVGPLQSALILRWAIPGGVSAPYDIPGQFKLLRALMATGLAVPEPMWLELDTDIIGHEFFTMRLVGGNTVPRVIARDDPSYTAKLDSYIETLASIHRTDYRRHGIHEILAEPTPETCAESALALQIETASLYGVTEHPVITQAFAWARARLPAHARIALIHGDPNMSNYRYDGDAVVAILDWEAAKLSDPLWDLAFYLAAIPKFYRSEPPEFQTAHREHVLNKYRSITGADYKDLPFWECVHLLNAASRSVHPAMAGELADVYFLELDRLTRTR